MPEELVKPEELSKYRQVASHVVSGWVASTSDRVLCAVPGLGQASLGGVGEERAKSRPGPLALFLPWPLSGQGFSSCPVWPSQ